MKSYIINFLGSTFIGSTLFFWPNLYTSIPWFIYIAQPIYLAIIIGTYSWFAYRCYKIATNNSKGMLWGEGIKEGGLIMLGLQIFFLPIWLRSYKVFNIDTMGPDGANLEATFAFYGGIFCIIFPIVFWLTGLYFEKRRNKKAFPAGLLFFWGMFIVDMLLINI